MPGHERVVVGLGAAHGFKFAPTFGRILADLAATGATATDVAPFTVDRPALTDPAYPPTGWSERRSVASGSPSRAAPARAWQVIRSLITVVDGQVRID